MAAFAFGQPVLPRPPSSTGPRRAYVLGAYPSGVHVAWSPPTLVDGPSVKPVKAMLVDNEPTPFWDGENADARFEDWVLAVGWRDDWGHVTPAPLGSNGPSGTWVSEHILAPLGLTSDDVCLSDCLDLARLNAGQAHRVADTDEPVRAALHLPACTLEPVPSGEDGIVREAERDHLDRIRSEIVDCQPSVLVTLGNAALRVMSRLVETDGGPLPRALDQASYGSALRVGTGGREMMWWPLVHPRSGERTPAWTTTHRAWEDTKAKSVRNG